MIDYGAEAAETAARAIRLRTGPSSPPPRIAIILGSGLGGLADDVMDPVTMSYYEVPGFPPVSVHGHAGRLHVGRIGNRDVLVFAGRFHTYEGHSLQLAAFPVRVAHALGVRTLFVSNAAGGINSSFQAGDLMTITDHINFMFASPLTGPVSEGDVRFPDMSNAYDPELRMVLARAAAEVGVSMREGVYCALGGPAYETPAEVRMLRTLGADAVGMSTVPEVIMARMLGMRVAGVSCITNMAAGIQAGVLDHSEVLDTTARVATQFQSLVRAWIGAIPEAG